MATDRRRRSRGGRGSAGRSSVFTPGSGQRGVPRFSPTASRQSAVGPPVGQNVVTPNVQQFAPQGSPATGFGAGSPLVDALMQEPQAQEFEAPAGPASEVGLPEEPLAEEPLAAAPEYGSTPYGDIITEPPITQAQVEQTGGAVPEAVDPFGVGSWMAENSDYARQTGTYNRNKLLRMLMEEGY